MLSITFYLSLALAVFGDEPDVPITVPVQYATQHQTDGWGENQVKYYKATLCAKHAFTTGKLARISIILPRNTMWKPNRGKLLVDVARGMDFTADYIGSNYKLTGSTGGEYPTGLSGSIITNVTDFIREDCKEDPINNPCTIVIRAKPWTVQPGAVTFNIDFVDPAKYQPTILNGPSYLQGTSDGKYNALSEYALVQQLGSVNNYDAKHYTVDFCGAEYAGQDWGVQAMVVATDGMSSFLTTMCPGNADVALCNTEGPYRDTSNVANSGINVVEVNQRTNPRFDFEHGFMLGVTGFGGDPHEPANNNFRVAFTTKGF